jgi:hypothetical protein
LTQLEETGAAVRRPSARRCMIMWMDVLDILVERLYGLEARIASLVRVMTGPNVSSREQFAAYERDLHDVLGQMKHPGILAALRFARLCPANLAGSRLGSSTRA